MINVLYVLNRNTIKITQNLSVFNTEYILGSYLMEGRKLLFTFIRQ